MNGSRPYRPSHVELLATIVTFLRNYWTITRCIP
eukprot:Gb_38015 [translate_table: standard]